MQYICIARSMLWLGVCPAITRQYCIETAERIKMLFGAAAIPSAYTLCYKGVRVSRTLSQTLNVADFWATLCKTVRPYAIGPLSVLSVQCFRFVTLVYCGQTVGWIRMPLGMEVGLGPGHTVLDGDPAPARPRKGHSSPQFSAHVYYGQTVAHLSYC